MDLDQAFQHFQQHGVVIIPNILSEDECDMYMSGIVSRFEALGTGIERHNIKKTWSDYNLPPQTRPGLFQCLMGNLPEVWAIRQHPRIQEVFHTFYSKLGHDEQLVVSGDGINIKPGSIGPYQTDNDWAHLDQTCDGIFRCIQGQVVLTNTTACFRASPRSHELHPHILRHLDINDNGNWVKFSGQGLEDVRDMVEDYGGEWQTPILSQKGSLILWSSTTIHSAMLQAGPEHPTTDPWNGWRGVVYVSYRPITDLSTRNISTRQTAYFQNRVTNHWSSRLFPKRPGGRWAQSIRYHPRIEELLNNPEKFYDEVCGRPEIDQSLIGM